MTQSFDRTEVFDQPEILVWGEVKFAYKPSVNGEFFQKRWFVVYCLTNGQILIVDHELLLLGYSDIRNNVVNPKEKTYHLGMVFANQLG